MLGAGVSLVLQALLGQVAINFGQVIRVLQAVVGLAHHALAGAANGHDGQVQRLGHGEGAGV